MIFLNLTLTLIAGLIFAFMSLDMSHSNWESVSIKKIIFLEFQKLMRTFWQWDKCEIHSRANDIKVFRNELPLPSDLKLPHVVGRRFGFPNNYAFKEESSFNSEYFYREERCGKTFNPSKYFLILGI